MHLKKNKSSFIFKLSLFTIVILLLLTNINKQKIKVAFFDLNQKALSADIGISSLGNLLDQGSQGGKEIAMSNIRENLFPLTASLIKSLPNIINHIFFVEDNFERIDVNIDFSNYLILMEDRDRALKNNILYDPLTVNAKLEYKGKKYEAKIRLKGDLSDHWYSKYRHSLRVKLKNDKTILDFNSFSIQKPRTRQFPFNHIFQSLVLDTGNLAAIHKFAHIYVNGVNWGIMDIEEHMSKELLEKQKRKDSIIVKFSNEDQMVNFKKTAKAPYNGYRLSDPFIFSNLYNEKSLKYLQNRKAYSYVVKNRLTNNPNLYDLDSFSKALILSLIWNQTHTLYHNNARYYFNPYTLKLEIITTDQLRWKKIEEEVMPLNSFFLRIPPSKDLLNHIYNNLKITNIVINNIDKHTLYFESLFPNDEKKQIKILKENIEIINGDPEKYIIDPIMEYSNVNGLDSNNLFPKKILIPNNQEASEFSKHLHIKHYEDGTLELFNLIPDNIIVTDILFNGISFIDKEIIIPNYKLDKKNIIIKTPFKGINDYMFTVHSQYKGHSRESQNEITLINNEINNQLLVNNAEEFSFIEKLNKDKYKINQGNWNISKPVILDGDLQISAGANLTFNSEAYIIIKGSLSALGEKLNPINLKAKSNAWKGIYVLNAKKKSSLKNINISNIASLQDGLLSLSGGITFYKSDVDFESVTIENVIAEDAINIVESTFSLNSVIIDGTSSDGLDSDFSKGTIVKSKFSNIGGDALDFSGSNAVITNSSAINVKDKAVSVGEKSFIDINNSKFYKIGIGVASKDGSIVEVSNTSIADYKLYALMSFIKKDFYGFPKINAKNLIISNGNGYLRQKGSTMIINGKEIPESEIDIKKLYELDQN